MLQLVMVSAEWDQRPPAAGVAGVAGGETVAKPAGDSMASTAWHIIGCRRIVWYDRACHSIAQHEASSSSHRARRPCASLSVAYLHDSQLFLDQLNKWQEILPVQPVFVQLRGWCVGGEDYHSSFPQQG